MIIWDNIFSKQCRVLDASRSPDKRPTLRALRVLLNPTPFNNTKIFSFSASHAKPAEVKIPKVAFT